MFKLGSIIATIFQSVIAPLSLLATFIQPAVALQCGDTITTDTILNANLGPCPSDGLIIRGTVTLDLNGHKITGSLGGYGLHFDGSQGATIKGPGTISNFYTGIGGGGAVSVLIYDLVLSGNQQGINMGRSDNIRVMNNVIVAKNSGGDGVLIGGNDTHIYQNTISGYAVGIFMNTETYAVVDENLITLNQTGIWAWYPDRSCSVVRGNRVTLNKGDGIRTGLFYGPVTLQMEETRDPCPQGLGSTIEDNTVNLNGGSGIVVDAGYDSRQSVQDNMVSFNKVSGIAIIGRVPEYPNASVKVLGNYTMHNGTDLFWNELGTTNCWQQNVFTTTSPLVLPGC